MTRHFAAMCGVVICYLMLILGYAGTSQPFVAFIDVKQGDATLWRDDNKHVYLMDVGGSMQTLPTARQPKMNYVGQQLCQVLKGYGITQIDHLILSHQDIDHIGNFAYIAKKIRIKHLYLPSGMQDTKNYQLQIAPYVEKDTIRHEVVAGYTFEESDCRVLHPFKRGLGKNEDSIVVTMKIAGKRYMLTGDLDVVGEQKILHRYQLPKIDILKCGHHGSRTSTGELFLAALQPKMAIVSAGKNNRFKHPHTEVVARLKSRHITMLNTADLGMITFDDLSWQSGLKKAD